MSSTTQTTTLQSNLEAIAKKSGKTLAEVQEAYDKALTTLPPSIKNEKRKEKTALMIVNRDLAVNTRSDAITYEGVIVGAKRARDLMARIRENALTAYKEDPQKTLGEGLVKLAEDGQSVLVLDNRATINDKPNKNFGKERPATMFMRECVITAREPGETDFICGKITLWNQQAKLTIPMHKLISFKANGGLDEATGELALRSSVNTQFEVKQELPDDEIVEIIDNSLEKHYKELGELFDYHKSVQGTPAQYESFIVTEGSVQWVNLSEDPTKNHSITINDNSLPEGSKGVKVWIPNELGHLINFGRDSIVGIIGYTSMGKGWDSEAKKQTDEEVLQINAYSVFGRPGLTTQGFTQGETV